MIIDMVRGILEVDVPILGKVKILWKAVREAFRGLKPMNIILKYSEIELELSMVENFWVADDMAIFSWVQPFVETILEQS
jgi:hypothetical protein